MTTLLDAKRIRANAMSTTYVYDFLTLFERGLRNQWKRFAKKRTVDAPYDNKLSEVQELVLDDDFDAGASLGYGVSVTERGRGLNRIGMVAWKILLRTPQYPSGRYVYVIANDITHRAGSFGREEDELFNRVSKLARAEGVPRLYITANSGARIGMADEVKRVFKVKWVDWSECNKGFEYLYLTEEDYSALGPEGRNSVVCEKVLLPNGIMHYKILDIIGEAANGVENLQGSATIAGETSRAYEDVFTLTYVSARSVGIGAYLVRLGQRTIQKGRDAPIILTGYQALNKLMGKDIYTSNLQLGGPKIMYTNGISHMCVRNDMDGVVAMLDWISYVPETKFSPLPTTKLISGDSIERDVLYTPPVQGAYDPRLLLTGCAGSGENEFLGGFFDRDSWMETLGGWAKTVVVGRARLGRLPVGVIITENRSVEAKSPADPASPDSEERAWTQAGQVWFPDSAHKTAQAIRDFNGESLPLFIFANWRGFSGGQRDMFDEVLKYGALIVDALVAYRHPVFVYIPPHSELRGGAWVVVDPTINPDVMEMYAAPEARGNVLEPAGAVNIKFRKEHLIACAHRLDPTLMDLTAQLDAVSESDASSIRAAIDRRLAKLLPIYHQIALCFGDLHDTPRRMLAKNVIGDVVPWREARRFFYYRLQRKLLEAKLVESLRDAIVGKSAECKRLDATPGHSEAKKELDDLVLNSGAAVKNRDASIAGSVDRAVLAWLRSPEGVEVVQARVKHLRSKRVARSVAELGLEDPRAMLMGLMGVLGKLGEQGRTTERENIVNTLRRGAFMLGKRARSANSSTHQSSEDNFF